METVDIIIKAGAALGALGAIGGTIYGVIKWVQRQNQQNTDIKAESEARKADVENLKNHFDKRFDALEKKHDEDIKAVKDTDSKSLQAINEELCVMSYALLAALDGLMQQGCNGNVTKAHTALEKHLNNKAHPH